VSRRATARAAASMLRKTAARGNKSCETRSSKARRLAGKFIMQQQGVAAVMRIVYHAHVISFLRLGMCSCQCRPSGFQWCEGA
jgi:hypothetical protein